MNDSTSDLYACDLSRAVWRKSSASGPEHNCVEVAGLPGGAVAIRDSKDTRRTPLLFNAPEWAAFRQGLISGEI
ncbi:DUF397 domain-containing protein [Streptomyces netropsis]|uniref:DUF397 domain-containing protein n=1 Tax=Streptomyces netropsis TaxID=55404 RepID=A0A7W7PBU5_STRNE|nr:DUF397 domain-containing protein [Streptomyces netropsis]MBB4884961.1 hypothetical protein [Streptomyces netropsis]GGR48767.1 hypothetical protein GCM10010219_62760 [Streptomyces netropsis]